MSCADINSTFQSSLSRLFCAHCSSYYELSAAKVRVNLCDIKKTALSQKFDITQIPSMYATGMKNMFELLDTAENMPNALWQKKKKNPTIIETAIEHMPK